MTAAGAARLRPKHSRALVGWSMTLKELALRMPARTVARRLRKLWRSLQQLLSVGKN